MAKAEIIHYHNDIVQKRYSLEEGKPSLIIGRDEECDICVDERNVSKHHGKFFLRQGAVYYTDMSSRNGSFVDGARIATEEAVKLENGSVITLSGSFSSTSFKTAVKGGVKEPEDHGDKTVLLSQIPPTGPSDGRRAPGERTVLIGSDSSCDIVIKKPGVSRFHAKAYIRDGRFFIEDTNSTNGTFLNGSRIERPCPINIGDNLYVADVSLMLDRDGVLRMR